MQVYCIHPSHGGLGVLHIHITYGVQSNDDNSKTPLYIGWYEHTIDSLEFNGCIPNPAFCEQGADYLIDEWLRQPAFYSMCVVELLRKGLGMKIQASNQLSEKVFQRTKGQEDLKYHTTEPAMYMHHWWSSWV